MTTRAALAGVLLAALLSGGCALLPPAAPPPAAAADDAVAPAPTVLSGPVTLEVLAPAPLRTLLLRHLDIVRLTELARNDSTIADAEWSRLVDATPAQARELLETEGYFVPVIEVRRGDDGSVSADPGRLAPTPGQVQLLVDPGPRARITRATVEVQGALERAAADGDAAAQALLADTRAGWAMPVGTEFRNAAWADAKNAALTRLRAAGYAVASWSGTAAEVDAEDHSVRIFVVADSGPLFRSGTLDIEGLERHDVQTIHNLANFEPGTPVTEALLLDFQERLQGAGLFDSASVTLEADPEQAERATLHVRLRESALQVYTLGIGVSTNSGPRASLEHTYRRVFGFAATARNKFELGTKRQAWDGELATHTRAGLHRNLLGGAIERVESGTDTVLSLRLRLGRSQDLLREETLNFVELERSQTRNASLDSNTSAVSLNQHRIWRALDSLVLPTTGYTLSAQAGVGYSQSNDANSGAFGRAYGRLTVYRSFGRDWFAQARVEAGQVFLPNGVRGPESQLFRAGGDDSVRGYAYRDLAPRVNGAITSASHLFTSSIELARPITPRLPPLLGAVFVDLGNAANSWGALDPALGVGVGLRFRSPVGPLRLDWAWGQQVHKMRVHFSVGIAL